MALPREWIGFALVVAALARAALLVAHEPVAGYANSHDMLRASACIGLYPAADEARRYAPTPQAPVPLYRPGPRRSDQCRLSTEVVIDAAVAWAAHRIEPGAEGVPLQWFGYAKLALLAIAALALALAFHGTPFAALLHGIFLFAVMADPAVTLWFNTLSSEFGAAWGAYVSVAALCALALTLRGAFVLTALLALGLAALAFSREQSALLPPLLVAAAAPWLLWRSSHAAVAAFGVALVAAVIAFGLVPSPLGFAATNRVDTYLGLVVPSASDPKEALATLGLPARCEAMVGATWRLRRGEALEEACPEAFDLPVTAFLRFARDDPATLARAAARVLPATQALVPASVGILAGAVNARLPDLPPWLASPLAALHARLDPVAYAAMLLCVFLAAPLGLLAAAGWARPARGVPAVGALLAMLLGGTALYAFVATAFADDASDPARHFLLGHLAADTAWIALILAAPSLLGRWFRAPRERAWEIAAAVVGVGSVVFACVAAIAWARAQPLGRGLLEAPVGREVPRGALAIAGWAVDPFGVEAVEVGVGSVRRTLHPDVASPDVQAALPGYPDSPRARFALELSAEELAQAGAGDPLPLRLLVRSRAGPVTEVDGRRLVLKP
ncbi:MAG TPA: hypothetical protein VHQ02_05470 [Usitatibacter sp.]|jgi:hypothetical protein|nr:hypothetical protein [Usitatibacter sp.]